MALSNLNGWVNNNSQQAAACGTACGAGDGKPSEKTAACGTACGAGDEK